jgi:glyoxalase-like protein
MNIAKRQKPAPGDLFLDHLAHSVPDLDAAAAVFEGLGFAVTPRSVHLTPQGPAGTSNRCVMLEEGYIELLAGTPERGLRLACFGTPDAAAEHVRLAAHGFEPPAVLDLSRKIKSGTVRFKVVRTGGKMPEGRVQYVQHLTPGRVWQKPFINKFKLTSLVVVADDAVAAAARWARFSGLLPRRTKEGIRLQTARGAVLIDSAFPWETPPAPALAGYGLACRNPKAFAARCSKAGMRVQRNGSRYVVVLPPVLGGAWLIG